MNDADLYAKPMRDVEQEDCYFYHSMNLPEVGEVNGHWDLRDSVDEYLGSFDFRGKRVLDVGSASGYLSFAMEARGAEVVSFDMTDGRQWNIVPHADQQADYEDIIASSIRIHERLKNAYWFAHEKLNSQARVHYGDIYNLPVELGSFDVVFFGMILGHLRDPFQALWSASRLCTGSIMVTNQWNPRNTKRVAKSKLTAPAAYFLPRRENGENMSWWALSDLCIMQMLEVIGFDSVKQVASRPQCLVEGRQQKEDCLSTVAQRVRGRVASDLDSQLAKVG